MISDPEFYTITDPQLVKYCRSYSSRPQLFLDEVAHTTKEKVGMEIMLSGTYLGQFIKMMSSILRPQNILEIGTFTGYGALCLLEGADSNSTIYTIEKSLEHAKIAKDHFEAYDKSNQITLCAGDASEIIADLDIEWDLVFIDAAKKQYSTYYDLIFPNLKSGGVILADNVLWKGKVGHPQNDNLGLGLDAFNKKVYEDARVDNIILPIDDGVHFIIKK